MVELARGGHCCFLFTRTFDVDPQQQLLWFPGCTDTMTVWVSHNIVCIRSQNVPSEDT